MTNIEWTDITWNPVTGCSKVSEGCRNCYAFELHNRRHKAYQEGKKLPKQYAKPFNEIQLFGNRLTQPLSWKKPSKVFVNSMSDLFHNDIPDWFIDQVFGIMLANYALDRQAEHTFQILTKRPERMNEYFLEEPAILLKRWSKSLDGVVIMQDPDVYFSEYVDSLLDYKDLFPLPNVWLGVSVENQQVAYKRIPYLLQTPAVVRFLSCEPLLDEIDLDFFAQIDHPNNNGNGVYIPQVIDWVIVGGESGQNARLMNPEWVRSLRDQCANARVPFFFKQWGGKNKKKNGRLLDGQEWNEMPKVRG